jgi:hypothetical protein
MPHTSDHGGAHAAHTPHDVPVQADNVSFRGIVWFLVIIFATVLFCQGLVVGIFKYLQYDVDKTDPARAFTAAPPSYPQIFDGRVVGTAPMPEPTLLTDDPENLARFRALEEQSLTTYGVIDKNAGTYRLPIEKAKDLLLAKGLPARPAPGK